MVQTLVQGEGAYGPPDFGRIEGPARQQGGPTLLIVRPDFQTLHHPCCLVTAGQQLDRLKPDNFKLPNIIVDQKLTLL